MFFKIPFFEALSQNSGNLCGPCLEQLLQDTIAYSQAMADCREANDTIASGNNYSEHSDAFARSLKRWDDNSMTKVACDDVLFNSKCRELTCTYDTTTDIDVVVQELFKEGKDWVDREPLFQAVKFVGKAQEFHITKTNNTYNATDLVLTNQTEITLKVLFMLGVHSV